jgi:uncharacterized membrane protein
MSISAPVLTILLMAGFTFLTRISGYLFLRERSFGPRVTRVLETTPGCVLVTVIAPNFVTGRPADIAALVIGIIAATRLSLLPTVILTIGAAGLLRAALG